MKNKITTIFLTNKFIILQDKYFSPKRTKPSLSIVNPLDVLRQRVMLEMARRQRENAVRQVRKQQFDSVIKKIHIN